MKSNDFFCLIATIRRAIFVGLACCFPLVAHAEPPPPEAFNQKSELILTLSDKWLESDSKAQNRFQKTNRVTRAKLITEKTREKQSNIGCGMDVNQNNTPFASLTSQVVGECNFNYQY